MDNTMYLQNRIHCAPRDQAIIQSISRFDSHMKDLGIAYSVIGSCAIQSFFDFFVRLPNDLDVVVRSDQASSLFKWSLERGIPLTTQLGRAKMMIGSFPIHILFDRMYLIDTSANVIFSSVGLLFEQRDLQRSTISLVNTDQKLDISVPSLEILLAVHMLSPTDTNDVHLIAEVLRRCDLNPHRMAAFMLRHSDLLELFDTRLATISTLLEKMHAPELEQFSTVVRAFLQGKRAGAS